MFSSYRFNTWLYKKILSFVYANDSFIEIIIKSAESVLTKYLFFTSNRLSNIMRNVADEAFSNLEISLFYVYLLVNQYSGITQL